ncbi:hypothetical protein [Natrinema sp. 74]|uniref:hypothetical protein n=1 Tax=Natrinema sp. 74 TaxID=3384159 RepID=UPI0038D4D333
MGWLGSGVRVLRNTVDKIRTGERWYDENIAQDMLAEVESAKEGDPPGEYGSRTSNWEEAVSATARRKADEMIRDAAEQYTEALEELEKVEEKRVNIAEHFIGNLPGGRVEGTQVEIVTGVTEREGRLGPAEPRPLHGSFDLWLDEAWPAFEEANSKSELRRHLESEAEKAETYLDVSVFQCWEDQLSEDNWHNDFWEAYNEEYLERYRQNINRMRTAKSDVQSHSSEVDKLIETKI